MEGEDGSGTYPSFTSLSRSLSSRGSFQLSVVTLADTFHDDFVGPPYRSAVTLSFFTLLKGFRLPPYARRRGTSRLTPFVLPGVSSTHTPLGED